MRKKLLRAIACVMVVVMVLSVAPLGSLAGVDLFGTTASAVYDDEDESYTLKYSIYGEEITIDLCNENVYGNVELPNFIDGYPVTTIRDGAFRECKYITNVILPDYVTYIGDAAFLNCSRLTKITIPDGVKYIGDYAFGNCVSLTSIDIPSGVKYLGSYALADCTNLAEITIPKSITAIEDNTFEYCEKLSNVIIPKNIVRIGNGAFSNCKNLKSVLIPSSVKSIGDIAFISCYNLSTVNIPSSTLSIGNAAFAICQSLTSINVDKKNKSYSSLDGVLFNKDMTELIQYPNGNRRQEYEVPYGVESIGPNAFTCCDNIVTVTLPDSLKSIYDDAFFNCPSIRSMTIPYSVTYIDDYAIGFHSGDTPKDNDMVDGFTIIGYDDTLAEQYAHENGFSFNSLGHVHKYTSKTTIQPTCTKSGIRTYTCSCGESYTETIKAKGHSFGKWTTTKNATYTVTGTQTRICAKCGAKETKAIAKLKTTTIAKCTFSTLKPATYTGKAIAPKITVKNGKTTLKSGTHYTVSYKNNTKIGKATVTIKGVEKSGYSGTKTLTFNILSGVTKSLKATQSTSAIKLTWSKVAGATGYRVYRHDGKKWVKLADTKNTTYTVSKLKAGTNYKYAVKAYTTVGKTVYWSASYAQISTATKPATPTVKVSAGKKQAALSWNKVTGASGYVVYYSTSKNGTYKKLATVKGTSYTAKKLATGKTYYFKVAAYKTVGKANIYGAYSTVKGVKVK